MTDIVTVCRALGDPVRWRIVRLVMDEALCVCELADILGMPQSTVSSHVQIIRKAELLESEKCEKWTYFRIERRRLKLLRAMQADFGSGTNPGWTEDDRKAKERMIVREESCCPGPKKLKPRKSPTLSSSL